MIDAGIWPFVLVLFLIAILLRVDFFFTAVYLVAIAYILARLWGRYTLGQITVERRAPSHFFPGETVDVDLFIRYHGRLPIPWLEIHESLPVHLHSPPFVRRVFGMRPKSTSHIRYPLRGYRRGYYTIGPLTIRTGDPLGLAPTRQQQVGETAVIVYPRVLPIAQLDLPTRSPQALIPARIPLFEDPTHIVGMRTYRAGDPLRKIHWTATARAGTLLVKQYQPAIARETILCLDLVKEHYDPRYRFTATELAITTVASLANHMVVNEKLPVGLMTEARDPVADAYGEFFLLPSDERGHLMRLLDILARVETVESDTFLDLLQRRSIDFPWGATIIVVTGKEWEALFQMILHLRRIGFAVQLIVIQPTAISPTLRQRSEAMGIAVHRIWREIDLEQGL